MSAELFAQIINIGLIVVFAAIIVGFVIAAFVGFKQGLWEVAYRFLFTLIMVLIAIFTINPLVDGLAKLNISAVIPFKGIIIAKDSLSYYAPITNFHDTLVSFFRGFYFVNNVSASYGDATIFAETVVKSTLKLVAFLTEASFITSLGQAIIALLWQLVFKHIIPKFVRKTFKLRWAGLGVNILTYLISSFLLIAPMSAVANMINQNYTKREGTNNLILNYLNAFVDSYDNSIFAKVFFNWTVNPKTGLTFDSAFISNLTKETSDGISFDVIGSMNELVGLGDTILDYLIFGEGNGIGIDVAGLATESAITSIFEALKDSELVLTILPLACDIALNSDLLEQYIDPSVFQLSDVDWKYELDVVEDVAISIVGSGIIDSFIDENGKISAPSDAKEIIQLMLQDKYHQAYIDALKKIDDSLLLKRSIPALLDLMIEKNPDLAKFFPLSFDQMNDISWGFELSTLYDCLYRMYKVDENVVPVIFGMISPSPTPLSAYKAIEPGTNSLIELLITNADKYSEIFVGPTDNEQELINIDANGRTIVYQNGKKIDGRSYCLFDISLLKYLVPELTSMISSSFGGEESIDLSNTIDELSSGKWMKNYKDEFASLFYVLEAFSDNPETFTSLVDGSFMEEGASLSSIDNELIDTVTLALPRIDNSKLVYALIVPLFKQLITEGPLSSAFSAIGFDNMDIIEYGLDSCIDNNELGKELALIFKSIKHFGELKDVLDGGFSSSELISQLGNKSLVIAHSLDCLYVSKILNPVYLGQENVNYGKVLNKVFSSLSMSGLGFTTSLLNDPAITWTSPINSDGEYFVDSNGYITNYGENGAIANVIRKLGQSNILEALSEPGFLSGANMTQNLASLENTYHLSDILSVVNNSYVFSSTMGTFLDSQLGSTGLFSGDVSFTNVIDWHEEGQKLGKVLKMIGKANVDFSALNFSSISDVVTLNDLIHSLADSSIFIKKIGNDQQYLFPTWLYSKLKTNLANISFGGSNYNLLMDPIYDPNDPSLYEWDTTWGSAPTSLESDGHSYTISEQDFNYISKSEWCDENYVIDDFDTSSYEVGFEHYWDNPLFYEDYFNIFEMDELSRITHMIYWVNKTSAITDIINIPSSTIEGLLSSLNNTKCLRIASYRFFEIAKDSFASSGSASFFNLDSMCSEFMISCGHSLFNYSAQQVERNKEIATIVSLYKTYQTMKSKEIIDGSNQIHFEKLDSEFVNIAKNAIISLQASQVFHRQGSSLDPDLENPNDGFYPTVLQNMLHSFLSSEDMSKIMYSNKSPKDQYYKLSGYFDPYFDNGITHEIATQTQLSDAKISYLLDNYLYYSEDKLFDYDQQINEVEEIFNVFEAIVGGPKPDDPHTNYVGLKDEHGNVTFDFASFNMSSNESAIAIEEIFIALNNTTLMFDTISNCMSEAIGSVSSSLTASLNHINFADANVFYQYFDNLSPSEQFNWNNKLTYDDISYIADIVHNVALYNNGDNSTFPDFEHLDSDPNAIVSLQSFLDDAMNSNIFHRGGTLKKISVVNGDGSAVISEATTSHMTLFQDIVAEVFDSDVVSYFLYRSSSPKDIEMSNLNVYDDTTSKAIYLAKTLFSYDGNGINALSLEQQSSEINLICQFFSEAQSLSLNSIDTSSMTDIDINEIINLLRTLNQTESLYDGVPNVLDIIFNQDYSSLDGVDLSDATTYYHYYESATADYFVKYDNDELNVLEMIVNDYQDLSIILDTNNLNDVTVLQGLVDNEILLNILSHTYQSEAFHHSNNLLNEPTSLTVFEQIINMIMTKSGITSYTYDINAELMMIQKIKGVTSLDELSQLDNSAVNPTGYHNRWLANDSNDEIHALIDFIDATLDATTSSSLSFESLSMNHISPINIKNMMYATNNVDLLNDVLPRFISDGFSNIGLDSLTAVDSTDYAYYDIGQYSYGSEPGSFNPYCEIENIYEIMNNMAVYDAYDNFVSYSSLNNIVSFSSSVTDFDGILRFISYSAILNTDPNGVKDNMWTLGGYDVSTRGLLLYNLLTAGESNPSNGADLGQYITGTSRNEKIATLSKLFTFNNYHYQYESKALYNLISNATEIDSNAINTNDFDSVANKDNILLSIIKSSYDSLNNETNKRSYICSEIISSLLDDVMINEYNRLNNNGYYYQSIVFGASSYSHLTSSSYDTLSQNEYLSLKGAFNSFKVIKQIVNTYTADSNEVKSAFSLMDNGLSSKIIYLSRLHEPLGTLTQTLPPPLNWSDYITNTSSDGVGVYDPSFSFVSYSNSLVTYLHL